MAGDLQVKSFMHKGIVNANTTMSIKDVTCILKDNNIGAVGVTDNNGKLVGMFSERDLVKKVIPQGVDTNTTPVSEVMTSPVVTIDAAETAQEALVVMNDLGIRHLPVIDGSGGPVGMLGLRDIMNVLMQKMVNDFLEA